jgi:hypothetical protein
MPESDFLAALHALRRAGVDFIVVGGVAAVLNGAPINTFDLDIVPARNEANAAKLADVLAALDAVYRIHASQKLKPTVGHLRSSGHHNLLTTCGPLDVLGTIGDGLNYEDLAPHSIEMEIGGGSVQVLDLPTLIALKEALGNEKDLAVLPILRRTLELNQK